MDEALDSGIVLLSFSALVGLVAGKGELALEMAVVALALVAVRVIRERQHPRRR